MSRFLLVPENFDLEEVKQVNLPQNLYLNTGTIVDGAQNKNEKQAENQKEKIENDVKGKYLSPSIVKYTFNQSKARKLLRFLKEKHFKRDTDGKLVFKNKVYPILLESCFLDLVNDCRKSKGSDTFYKLLRENDLDKNILPKSKQKYFN